MGSTKNTVLVSIVSTSDALWLGVCLKALDQVSTKIDVVVVANDCDDNTDEVCTQASIDVTLLKTEKRLGFAACNNLCLTNALNGGYEYAFLLNPDTKAHPQAIDALVRFMNSHPEYGIVGSIQIEYGDETWSQQNEWSRQTLGHAATLGEHQQSDCTFTWMDHSYVQGAALMMRLDLVKRIGLLDPVYRTFYEETDLCRRCLLASQGVAILFDSMVQHYGGGNWKASLKRHYERDRLFLRNQFLYYLSGEDSRRVMALAALRLFSRQMKTLWFHQEDVILPWWQYPVVLWSAMFRLNDVFRLYRRNEMIRSGAILPEDLWQIGRDRR